MPYVVEHCETIYEFCEVVIKTLKLGAYGRKMKVYF